MVLDKVLSGEWTPAEAHQFKMSQAQAGLAVQECKFAITHHQDLIEHCGYSSPAPATPAVPGYELLLFGVVLGVILSLLVLGLHSRWRVS